MSSENVLTPYEKVLAARKSDRPDIMKYIEVLFDDFIEFPLVVDVVGIAFFEPQEFPVAFAHGVLHDAAVFAAEEVPPVKVVDETVLVVVFLVVLLFSVFPDGLFQVFMHDVHDAADEGDDGSLGDFKAFQVIKRLVDGGAIHLVFFDRTVVPVEFALARCRFLFLRLDVETGQGKEGYPYCFFHVPVLMRCGLGV